MKINEFDINNFIDCRILSEEDNSYLYLETKESLYKQVKSILEKTLAESHHVLKEFPLECFDEEDISKFLKYILNLKQKVNREILSEMDKTKVDIDISKWLEEYDATSNFFGDQSCITQFDSWVIESRNIIRKNPYEYVKLFEMNKEITECLLSNQSNYFNLSRYINFSENIILQSIIYWILNNDYLNEEVKKEYLLDIEVQIDLLDKDLSDRIKNRQKKNRLNIDDAIITFIEYIKKRNYYGEYICLLKTLEEEEQEESDLFTEVKPCYKVHKDSKIGKEEIHNIITEGKEIYDIEKKLDEVKRIIEVFKSKGGRVADVENILDIKVYFREIFISKSKYKLQAKRMIRKYLEAYEKTGEIDSFENESEYMFFREKISRGYFRELGNLNDYNEKNRLQIKLYELLKKVYLLYGYKDSIEGVYSINYYLLVTIIQLVFEKK